jgi:hypothetical protein
MQTVDTAKSSVFSRIPSSDSRIAYMEKAIQELPPKTLIGRRFGLFNVKDSADEEPRAPRPSLLHPNDEGR